LAIELQREKQYSALNFNQNRDTFMSKVAFLVTLLIITTVSLSISAEIITDGSLGKRVGNNLFHRLSYLLGTLLGN